MATKRTLQQQLADAALGEPVEDWIARHRSEGLTWSEVAYRFRQATPYAFSGETLRRWAINDSERPERRSA